MLFVYRRKCRLELVHKVEELHHLVHLMRLLLGLHLLLQEVAAVVAEVDHKGVVVVLELVEQKTLRME